MKRSGVCILIMLAVFVPAGHSHVQAKQKIDSLAKILAGYTARDTFRIFLLNQIGQEYWTIDPQQAEKFGKEAATLSSELNYLRGMAMAHRVMGVSYWSRGDFYHALTYLFSSQRLYKNIGDKLGEANSTMNTGLIYADQKNYGRALESFEYANQLFEMLHMTDRIGITYNKIGTVYLEKGDLKKSDEYLHKALEIHQKQNFKFGIMEATNRLGLLKRELGDYTAAKEYLQQSLTLARENLDTEHTAKNLENLASISLLEKKFREAKQYLDEAYPLAMHHQYRKWLRDIYKDYKELYGAQGNTEKALLYTEYYETIKDSIFSEEKAAQLVNLQLEYQAAQQQQALKLKEQQIVVLEQQSQLDRLIKVVLGLGILAVILVTYLIFRYQRLRSLKNQELARIELENLRLREADLRHSLDFKNKELTAYTVNFIRKNELIDQMREKLEAMRAAHPESAKELNPLYALVQQTPGIDKDWEDFKRTFENVHHNFFSRLLAAFPDLTPAELRLCALICLNLSMKEMSSLMGISPDSVKTARYRLRKKFNLPASQNLADFVIAFTQP